MLPANTVASVEVLGTLMACLLGIGFMIRFFVALADDRKMKAVAPVRRNPSRFPKYAGPEPGKYRRHVGNPAELLAIGVLRITKALASRRRHADVHSTPLRPYLVKGVSRSGGRTSANESIYRSG
jgi:hypothetical protein